MTAHPGDGSEAVAAPTGRPRRWRRRPTLRRQLAITLVSVAALSILLVGGLNFVAANDLLVKGTADTLVRVGESRAKSIELGSERILDEVELAGSDPALADALEDL